MFNCQWCGSKIKPKNLWTATRKSKTIMSDPDGNEYELKTSPEVLTFCSKSHRNEFLYGV